MFMFPFRWDYMSNKNCFDTCIDNRLNVEKFINSLDKDKWDKNENAITNNLEYNQYAYFYDNVRDAIYGKKLTDEYKFECKYKFRKSIYSLSKKTLPKKDLEIVYNYEYVGKFSEYKIRIKKKDKDEKHYSLDIKNIKLKIYDTGVAVLSYFLDNYEYKHPEDILNINDYGRRIYPQYYPLDKVQNSFLATELSIVLDKEITENFNYDIYKEPDRISKTILTLLGDKFKCIKEEAKKDDIFINPVIDDRMFTICIYRNNVMSKFLTNNENDRYLKSDFWYKYIFIDNDSPTCQDDDMFKELLKKSTYTRWKNYKTLFGISRYSFVAIKDKPKEDEDEFLINHFKTLYYEMVLLALTQRASILRFSDEVSKITQLDKDEALDKTKQLQKHYLWFVNKLSFREVTAQEQGIELYDKLIEMMRIEKDIERLDKEIDEVNSYAAFISNEKTNNLLNIVTFTGIGIAFMTLIATIVGLDKEDILGWVLKYQYVPFAIVMCCITFFKKMANKSKLLKTILWVMGISAIIGIMYYLFELLHIINK